MTALKRSGKKYDELIVVEDVSLSGGGARPIFNYFNYQVSRKEKDMAMVRLVYRNSFLKMLYYSLRSDTVIVNSLTCYKYWSVILVTWLKKNTVIYLHDCAPHTEPFEKKHPFRFRLFLRFIQKRKVGFVSEWQSEYWLQRIKVPRYKIIYNNISFSFEKAARQTLIVGMVAYQNENKNVSFFSHVADEAARQGLPYSFIWAGGQGGDTSGLYHSTHVRWLGDQEHVMDLLNQVDLLLFTSKADSFPLVFAEALFKGKRIVSYSQNGFAQHVKGLPGCRLYDAFDEKKVLALLQEVQQEQPDTRRHREIAENLCSIENFEKRIEELFEL